MFLDLGEMVLCGAFPECPRITFPSYHPRVRTCWFQGSFFVCEFNSSGSPIVIFLLLVSVPWCI